jgi:hypothetical protein
MQSLHTLARSLSSSLIPSSSLPFSLGYILSVSKRPAGMDYGFGAIVFSVIFCLPQVQWAWGEGRNGCCGGAGAADGADVAQPRVELSPLILTRDCFSTMAGSRALMHMATEPRPALIMCAPSSLQISRFRYAQSGTGCAESELIRMLY